MGDYEQPMVQVHDDQHATSEDFWTVGNAARWMLLASRVLGLDLTDDGEGGVLGEMGIGKKLEGRGLDGENVWKMVMGSEMLEGEGALI